MAYILSALVKLTYNQFLAQLKYALALMDLLQFSFAIDLYIFLNNAPDLLQSLPKLVLKVKIKSAPYFKIGY